MGFNLRSSLFIPQPSNLAEKSAKREAEREAAKARAQAANQRQQEIDQRNKAFELKTTTEGLKIYSVGTPQHKRLLDRFTRLNGGDPKDIKIPDEDYSKAVLKAAAEGQKAIADFGNGKITGEQLGKKIEELGTAVLIPAMGFDIAPDTSAFEDVSEQAGKVIQAGATAGVQQAEREEAQIVIDEAQEEEARRSRGFSGRVQRRGQRSQARLDREKFARSAAATALSSGGGAKRALGRRGKTEDSVANIVEKFVSGARRGLKAATPKGKPTRAGKKDETVEPETEREAGLRLLLENVRDAVRGGTSREDVREAFVSELEARGVSLDDPELLALIDRVLTDEDRALLAGE